jgi:YegS/Rv2252/BmrU family lipid kinase
MKTLFLVNPSAGRGAALKTWRRIEPLVAGDRTVDVVIPDSAAATRKAAADAVKAGYDRVVAVGGDGTLLSVADELAHTETALGAIPAGTGNDFCRSSGIPRRIEEALAIALGPHVEPVDLGEAVGGRHFLNAAGVGFDAEAAAAAAKFPTGLGGNLPYLLGIFDTLLRWRPVEAEITVDAERYTGPITLAAVANGRYYGGGFPIAPGASRYDGCLDVVVAEGLSRTELLGLLPRLYAGTHVHSPKVRVMRGQEVQVRMAEPMRAHVDGEALLFDSLAFRVRPKALLAALPRSEAGGGELPHTVEARR